VRSVPILETIGNLLGLTPREEVQPEEEGGADE
jgi:hypothetical protein